MFSRDARKVLSNLKKHGVSFEEAATVFGDPETLDWDDSEHSRSEVRFKRLPLTAGFRLSVTRRRKVTNDKEIMRIISARQATRKERQAHAG